MPLAWTNLELNSEFSDHYEGDFFPYDIVKNVTQVLTEDKCFYLVVFRNIANLAT